MQKNYLCAKTDDNSDIMLVCGGHDITQSEGTQMMSDRITDSAPDIDFYCIQNSKTQEELTNCFQNDKHQSNENKPNQMNKRDVMCGLHICGNSQPFAADKETKCNIKHKSLKDIVACIKAKMSRYSGINRLFKVNTKRNPFCGRFGCLSLKREVDKMLPGSINTFDPNCLQQYNKIEEAMNCLHVNKVPKYAETINKSGQKRNPFCGRYGCGRRRRSVKRFACNRYQCKRSLSKALGASDRLIKQNMKSLRKMNELKKLVKWPVPEVSAISEYFTIPNTDELQLRTYKHKTPISNDESSADESTSFTRDVPDELSNTIKRGPPGNCGGTNTNDCVAIKTKISKKKKIIKQK